MELELTPEPKLSREEVTKVIAGLQEKVFYSDAANKHTKLR